MGWLDAVAADLEAQAYAFGAAVLPACAVGAPHIRSRIWFVADANAGRQQGERQQEHSEQQSTFGDLIDGCRAPGRRNGKALADAPSGERDRRGRLCESRPAGKGRRRFSDGGSEIASEPGSERLALRQGPPGQQPHSAIAGSYRWAIEPDVGRVAHGVPARVHKLRALGNAIVPALAAQFIKAVM
jgi:DNA (cytosine-5)-methyltransferase 1